MKPRLKWCRHHQHWFLVCKDNHGRWDYRKARLWKRDVDWFNINNDKRI